MASEMIERVAISIWNKMTFGFGTNSTHWVAQPEMITNHYREVAKAAIASMREPTNDMINASRDQPCLDAWRDMIDEALEE